MSYQIFIIPYPSQANKQTSTPDSQATLVKSALTPSFSNMTMVESNHNITNSQANFGPVIPQLDGILNSLPPATHTFSQAAQQSAETYLQCETCHKTFDTEDQFNDHDNAHNYCCDECYLCFTTQLIADLHELEYHPNTHYSDTYIPQSTKLLFASGQSENQPKY